MEPFDISVAGFSGPLDLLCGLVESRQMEASRVSVTQLVRIYGAYLARERQAPVEAIAEFFWMVAGLLLQKARSLLPGAEPLPDVEEPLEEELDEGALMEALARYRPYRAASRLLWDRLAQVERSFRRPPPDEGEEPIAPEARWGVGDLYLLARVWWGVYERHERAKGRERAQLELERGADWDGLGDPIPDEEQIQARIVELEARLAEEGELWLSALCRRVGPSVRALVMTLLALLEMCRMGKIDIAQEEPFADVKILARRAERAST